MSLFNNFSKKHRRAFPVVENPEVGWHIFGMPVSLLEHRSVEFLQRERVRASGVAEKHGIEYVKLALPNGTIQGKDPHINIESGDIFTGLANPSGVVVQLVTDFMDAGRVISTPDPTRDGIVPAFNVWPRKRQDGKSSGEKKSNKNERNINPWFHIGPHLSHSAYYTSGSGKGFMVIS